MCVFDAPVCKSSKSNFPNALTTIHHFERIDDCLLYMGTPFAYSQIDSSPVNVSK